MLPDISLIKKKRKALGLTQRKLAKQVSISQSMLAKIENGNAMPSYALAKKLFELLEDREAQETRKAKDVIHPNVKVIELDYNDSISKAVELAKKYSISQFPVIRDNRVIGAITTMDMIGKPKNMKAGEAMGSPLPTVNADTRLDAIKELLKGSPAVLVYSNGTLVGIITAEDLL